MTGAELAAFKDRAVQRKRSRGLRYLGDHRRREGRNLILRLAIWRTPGRVALVVLPTSDPRRPRRAMRRRKRGKGARLQYRTIRLWRAAMLGGIGVYSMLFGVWGSRKG